MYCSFSPVISSVTRVCNNGSDYTGIIVQLRILETVSEPVIPEEERISPVHISHRSITACDAEMSAYFTVLLSVCLASLASAIHLFDLHGTCNNDDEFSVTLM
jgi:hypothetical protein